MRREECPVARERGKRALAPLFICFSVPGPVLRKLGQPGVLLFYLGFSLRSSDFPSEDLPLFYFQGLLPSRSFSHRHSGLLFPILATQQFHLSHWGFFFFYLSPPSCVQSGRDPVLIFFSPGESILIHEVTYTVISQFIPKESPPPSNRCSYHFSLGKILVQFVKKIRALIAGSCNFL